VLGRFALDLARQGIQSGSAGCSGSAATPPGPETYATTLAVGSDIGGEEGLAVDHPTSATWQPDRRWRPGRRGRAAGSASTQYCGA
jgi:hypothetical protein